MPSLPDNPLVWDKEDVMRRMRNKFERIARLLALFSDTLPEYISAIDQALQNRDWASLKMQLHTLKGNAGNISAVELFHLSREMEGHAEAQDANRLNTLMVELRAAVQRFEAQTPAALAALK